MAMEKGREVEMYFDEKFVFTIKYGIYSRKEFLSRRLQTRFFPFL